MLFKEKSKTFNTKKEENTIIKEINVKIFTIRDTIRSTSFTKTFFFIKENI